jgi:benzylsuccinate CoA-transferase BbsE subunit
MADTHKTEGNLTGLRVLDLAHGGAQICGKILADLGADVIKIEPPGGDLTGRIAPYFKDIPDPQKSLFWFAYNTSKRGLTLNLKTSDGQIIFKKLAARADILIETFSPGYLDSLGVGYSALSEINPRLIVTSITPYGQSGPKALLANSELTSWASSGGLYATGEPDGSPVWISFPQPLSHAGVEACIGTLIAYWQRTKTGEGQQVDVSMQDTFSWSTDQAYIQTYEMNGIQFHRTGHKMPFGASASRSQLFACKDGFIAFQLTGGSFPNVYGILRWMVEEGMAPEWLANYDWVKDYDGALVTQAEVDRVEAEFSKFIATKTKKELFDQAIPRNMQLAPVYTAEDICSSEHLKARNLWVDVKHDELGSSIKYPGLYNNGFSLAPARIGRRAPLIGEHNLEIYEGELGFRRADLVRLKEAGAI